jgi:hypothetical protein
MLREKKNSDINKLFDIIIKFTNIIFLFFYMIAIFLDYNQLFFKKIFYDFQSKLIKNIKIIC